MGTSSISLNSLASTTGALWSGMTPVLIAAFSIGIGFFLIFALVKVIRGSVKKVLR